MKRLTTKLTVFALALMLSATALGQGRRAAPTHSHFVIDEDGSPIGHIRGTSGNPHGTITAPKPKVEGGGLKEFDKGYLPAYVSRRYRGTATGNQGGRGCVTRNGSGVTTIDGVRTSYLAGPLDHGQSNGTIASSGAGQHLNH